MANLTASGIHGRFARLPRALAPALVLLLLAFAGCGGGAEVGEGAEVAVYASQGPCGQAQRGLTNHGADAGDVKVRVVCVDDGDRGKRLDLAAAGAAARRATEDSSSVAFLAEPGREEDFIRPILDEARIALIADRSGAAATAEVLKRLEARGSGESPREAVWSG